MPTKRTKKTSSKATTKTRGAAKGRLTKERRPVSKKFSAVSSLDVDRAVREEVTEWFTSNRKGLETVFNRVADQVREDLDEVFSDKLEELREKHELQIRTYAEQNAELRERSRNLEEELKRLRSVLGMVRNQVAEESVD